MAHEPNHGVVERLRAAGSVFAEDEARLLGDDEALIARRIAGERLEHVLGWVDFAGVRVEVDPGVFIPRPQTEAVAEWAAALRPAVALDLFAGCEYSLTVETGAPGRVTAKGTVGRFAIEPEDTNDLGDGVPFINREKDAKRRGETRADPR